MSNGDQINRSIWEEVGKIKLISRFEDEPSFVSARPDSTLIHLQRIEEKLDTIMRRLDLIFGNEVLIKGRFVSLKEIVKP